jgi:subtilase family serine protease
MVSALCPNCNILLVEANSNSYADLGAAVNEAAGHPGVVAISNSYGGSEFSSETTYSNTYYDHPGQAVTVATGDNAYGTAFPAVSPYVTAVGGTHLTRSTSPRGWSETAWSGAGSGCSTYVSAKPTGQPKIGTCSHRIVADVSAVADPSTGVAVYDSYGSSGGANWMVFGGTSVATPIIASVYALAGNTSSVCGPNLPYADHAFLNDVVGGSNGNCATRKTLSNQALCTAVSGFDGPTGLGTPNGTGSF